MHFRLWMKTNAMELLRQIFDDYASWMIRKQIQHANQRVTLIWSGCMRYIDVPQANLHYCQTILFEWYNKYQTQCQPIYLYLAQALKTTLKKKISQLHWSKPPDCGFITKFASIASVFMHYLHITDQPQIRIHNWLEPIIQPIYLL